MLSDLNILYIMIKLNIDDKGVLPFIEEKDINDLLPLVEKAHDDLVNYTGKGNEFLGWVDLPNEQEDAFLEDITAQAKKIKEKAEVYVVIGIGGSYLGARAVIESLQQNFNSLKSDRDYPFIIYAGQTLSEDYISDLLEILDKKDYCLSVISKSGTTTEPAIAFRILKAHLENKYGKEEARQRIIAITDKERGALKTLAIEEGYKTFIVPDNVGGRYSVLTPVGLLPIAVAGFDIKKLIEGAKAMRQHILENKDILTNPAWRYALLRNALLRKGKTVEIMVNYLPSLVYFSEWWKQLYGESEGKEGKGLFTASVSNTTDLHSMGQYIQEGMRNIFETVLHVENSSKKVEIPFDKEDKDGLNYLLNKSLTEINHKAEEGTIMAHIEGNVPNIHISIERLDEYSLGELIYFYEFACGISGYVLGVNPFDQPGVEFYKRNMFKLLGK